jgi:predicted O-methyltransferase YrrM
MSDRFADLIKEHFGQVKKLEAVPIAVEISSQACKVMGVVDGTVTGGDGIFLLSLMDHVKPNRVLEVGVLAGGSSYLMLTFLARAGSEGTLTSVDALDYSYPHQDKKLGYLVYDHISPLPQNWTVIGGYGVSNFTSSPKMPVDDKVKTFDFAFVDAHHGHPWPALDVLCLLPRMEPNSWIALHDVSLTLQDPNWAVRGPQFLLEKWPLASYIAPDEAANIGAIQLSDNREADIERLMRILEIPWEYGVAPYWEAAIMDCLGSAFAQSRDLPLAPG